MERRGEMHQDSKAPNGASCLRTSFVLQFIAIENDSNLVLFDYGRQIYLAGVEYTF
jgi:hypothetical protein